MKASTAMTTRAIRTSTDVYGPPTQRCTSRLIVPNAHGLHARPAALLVKAAQAFDTEILMECDGHSASAKSILGIMTLGAKEGAIITVTATGHDAAAALRAIEKALVFFDHKRTAESGVERPGAVGHLACTGQAPTAVTCTAARLGPNFTPCS